MQIVRRSLSFSSTKSLKKILLSLRKEVHENFNVCFVASGQFSFHINGVANPIVKRVVAVCDTSRNRKFNYVNSERNKNGAILDQIFCPWLKSMILDKPTIISVAHVVYAACKFPNEVSKPHFTYFGKQSKFDSLT